KLVLAILVIRDQMKPHFAFGGAKRKTTCIWSQADCPSASLLDNYRLRRSHHHRPNQPRFQQWRILIIKMPGCECESVGLRSRLTFYQPFGPTLDMSVLPLYFRRKLLIADQPVRPQIGNFHRKDIPARFEKARHI